MAGPALLLTAAVASGQGVTTPAEHLGRPVGADFELADWQEVSSYFKALADESPNVITSSIGTTTEGREFLLSVVSGADNLQRLDEIKALARTIADPRGRSDADKQRAVDDGRVILLISCAMHSTETAAPQFAMEFAHALATSDDEPWASARERLVVGIFPCLNPDGLDHVVSWYRETVGTPYEATALLKLYQLYSGHDNNRDWFMLTQAETRIVTEQLYSEWCPHVYWDVHQQGSSRERMFVPPFRDPLNPNLDPAIIAGIDALGSRALLDMTREGLTGISTGVSYDMWWNGGNRNVPVRHNIIGLLTEAASVRYASPIFLPRRELAGPRGLPQYGPSNQFPAPWPGGWWRLRDIIDYEMAFGRSLLGSLARERRSWLRNALEAAERTIEKGRREAPRAWLIPSDNRDPAAVRRLVGVLLRSGVEVQASTGPVEADGRTYPAGTLVVKRDQPYGSHVKDLFEVQRYPEGQPPYDVAGWTLPLLLGVRRVEAMHDPPEGVELEPVESAEQAVAGFAGDPALTGQGAGVHALADSDTWRAIFAALQEGGRVTFRTDGERAGLVEIRQDEAPEQEAPAGEAPAEGGRTLQAMPRVGLYAPWRGSMDEGWTRWVFESFEVPYRRVRNEMLRAGSLGDFLDVLVIPSISAGQIDEGRPPGTVPHQYAGGLDPEGAVAVEEFVRGGGTLIVFAGSTAWAVELLKLPLQDVARGEEAGRFACPGSVLRGVPASDAALTAGLPASLGLFFSSRCSAWRVTSGAESGDGDLPPQEDPEVLLRYAPTRLLLSGWIRQAEVIAGHAGWVRAGYGQGAVHLFGFRPQFRGWTQATFHLLFRAMLLR